MPAVVTFFQLPDDEKAFLDFLLRTGNIVALPSQGVKTKEELLPQPIVPYIEQHDPGQLRFGLEQHARQATIESMENQGEKFFTIAYMTPCLIFYTRGKIQQSNRLTRSNLAAYWEYPNESATQLLGKDPEFITWAKNVFRWVRRTAPRQLEYNGCLYRATQRVKIAFQAGRLNIVVD